MKKITLAAAAAFAAIAFSACGNSTPKADLKTDVDTLSYAMGVAQTGDFKNVLSERMGVDTTYINEFIKGVSVVLTLETIRKRLHIMQVCK